MPSRRLSVGFTLQERHFAEGLPRLRETVAAIADAGLDFVGVLDHLSFWDGTGFDSIVNAAAVAAVHPSIPVMTAVTVMSVRHPVLLARELSSLSLLAPGRLTLGVGVGGEDRREIEAAGVDPSVRGARMDESLQILRDLAERGASSFQGTHFALDDVRITPRPEPRIPIIVGGRSDRALRRAARFGDGWLGFACSPERFSTASKIVREEAAVAATPVGDFNFGLSVWCGVANGPAPHGPLARQLEALYKLPYERFARYCPVGSPADIAAELARYVEAGCTRLCLMPVGGSVDEEIAAVAAIKRHLIQLH
ncbi:MAG TPA: LLM class flavin-dependent oxidoreductase [Ilumatobacter sp.]|nr:LLM class flavin-dependent oxidoreductase [Ilumatobacter sp.]